ncbi:transposase protein orfB [Pseudomonas coronafaciens pv. zizaniae]|nr:transposase protein orfB [Pseudomonas coronafaciens pv. zizaniae]
MNHASAAAVSSATQSISAHIQKPQLWCSTFKPFTEAQGSYTANHNPQRKKTCKSAFSWAFQIFEMVGRVGFEPKTNWLKEKWHYLTVAMGLSARRMVLRSLKTEWIPTVDYMAAQEAQRGISHDLMHRYNWIRPYQPNDGLPPAQDGKNLNVVSGIRSPLHRGDGPAQLFVR